VDRCCDPRRKDTVGPVRNQVTGNDLERGSNFLLGRSVCFSYEQVDRHQMPLKELVTGCRLSCHLRRHLPEARRRSEANPVHAQLQSLSSLGKIPAQPTDVSAPGFKSRVAGLIAPRPPCGLTMAVTVRVLLRASVWTVRCCTCSVTAYMPRP
jgi:hypothetical protein